MVPTGREIPRLVKAGRWANEPFDERQPEREPAGWAPS